MARRGSISALLAVMAAITAACASAAGNGVVISPDPRVVELTITADARFSPDHIGVKTGETIRFVVRNPTSSDHELFIGSATEQRMHHDAHLGLSPAEQAAVSHFGYGIFLPAFANGVLEYHFADAGEVVIGCHLPGHYEGGHFASVTVEP